MQKLRFDNIRSILCLGAHADDIEIGCGGTLLKLLGEFPDAKVQWVVLSATGQRADEAKASANDILREVRDKTVVVNGGFRDSYFPSQWREIKDTFAELQREVAPDLIFTHRLEDRHQDHRVTSELTWCLFRNHLILEYEIPKYEGDLGQPNVFVPLSKTICQQKIGAVLQSFRSQHDKPWFTDDTFWSLLRLRGLECNSDSKFAEAFHCRKLIL